MMSRPKVLMFIDWYLPGFRAGGPIRSCANLVAHLKGDIDFYILCSDRDYQSDSPYEGIETEQWIAGDMGEQVMYVEPSSMSASFIRNTIKDVGFDCIYIHGLFSARFSIAALRATRNLGIPSVVAPRGMLRESAMSIKGGKKRLFLTVAKRIGLFKGLTFHATDEQEAKDICQRIGKEALVRIAPNLPRAIFNKPNEISKNLGELRLIFAGRIAPEKNLLFALDVLSKVKEDKISLDVYGAVYDDSYHERCIALVHELPENITVRFFEPLPSEEVLDLLSRHHALFLPTRGENFGHIILESLMAARPVLISDQTPWVNLEEEGTGHAISLDSPDAFVQRIEIWARMEDKAYQMLCKKSYDKAKRFCEDPELIAASKALFLPA